MNLQGRDLELDHSGDDVRLLHSELVQIGFTISEAEQQQAVFGQETYEAVVHFQKEHRIEPIGVVNAATASAIGREVEASRYTVSGTVTSPDRPGVGGLRVQVVDKNVGADVPLKETTTDERGRYAAHFTAQSLRRRHKQQPDLQARVYAEQTFLAASEVRYNASKTETLDVALPANATALPSEYETLTTTLKAHYAGQLGDLQENADRQDITYLANKTGWDARAVALAALADQFSQNRTSTTDEALASGIKPEFYYALFRAGLPANETLYQANPQMVRTAWKQAIAQGVIPQELESEVAAAVQTFQALSAARSLDARPSIGLSTLKQLLQLTLGEDTQLQQQFADLYVRYQDDLPTFWSTLEHSLGAETTKRLQLDGQLGYLTLNNAPLIAYLHDTEQQSPLTSMLDLVQRGYYQPAKWEPLLDGTIPAQIPGSTLDEQRANYAEMLATQVRTAFPTAVIADSIKRGAVPISGGTDVQHDVFTFLTTNQGTFEIGMEPVERYLARTNLDGNIAKPVVEQIKRLQRVYQITPTDQAFTVLLQHNLDSAYAITRHDQATFVRSFQDELGGETIANLTYAKAQQVYSAVLNVVISYLTARRAPALGSNANALVIDPTPVGPQSSDTPIIAYPTLEGLFGSMDYCACDECRSILSPAAYLVDLLQFIDIQNPKNKNPQDVLLGRRPDIQYLSLTCENTNIALPYIDLVNETLEYFVANGLALTNYSGHNTDGTIPSDELLASPQFVNDAAYTTLQTTLFPPPLPFHRPLELLRLHFQKFGIELQVAMAVLRPSDAIERDTAAYGWRDILMEQLGLSRVEYQLLTDSTLALWQLYGYPAQPDTALIPLLSRFQDFSRRVGVSYDDLVSILQTRFINPNSTLIPRLERLNVSFTTLQALKNGAITDAAFEALLPAGLDPGEYGGNILAWVKDPTNYAHIMSLITITDTGSDTSDPCSAANLQFLYANPDSSANTLHVIDFVRLLRFIRLWQKLGLTIEQTDDLISALYPAADLPTGTDDATDLQHLDDGFKALLPRIGFAFQVMNLLQLSAHRDLQSLLACWVPIGLVGANSLYQAMFPAALLQQDPAFADDGYGNILQNTSQKLFDHEPALRAAFTLTGAEFTLITSALGFDAATLLTLENISAIYRYGWLTRKLELSVVEFLLLKQFTSLDPFAAPDPSPTPPAEPPVIRFIHFVQALGAASLRPVQALYLIWNQDISGKSAPPDAAITSLASTLRADFAAVESQFALVDDPNGDIAKALMTLVYGTESSNFFFGLLNNTLSVSVPYDNLQPTLPQPILDAASDRLSYDDLRKQLTYTGVLDAATLAALNSAIGANAPLQTTVAALSAANHQAVDPFFATYSELLPLYTAYVASNAPLQMKRTALLANFLPGLKLKRKQEQALAAITAATGTDSSYAPVLLDDVTVLHAGTDNTLAILNDLTAVEAQGLSVQFFLTNNLAAAPDTTVDVAPTLSYTAGGSNPLPAGNGGSPIAGVWSGYLDVPQDGFYNISIVTDPGATVALEIGGAKVTMVQNGTNWSNASSISLTAGVLTAIVLTVTTMTGTLTVSWQSAGLGRQVIPGTYLYSATLVDHLRAAYVRFLKATSLATALSLTADEIAYLASNGDLQVNGQGWLNTLPVSGSPDIPTATGLRDDLSSILDFSRIKAVLSPNDERLLAVLENPAEILPNGDSALLTLTRWDQDSLNALLTQFFSSTQSANLTHLENFRRVYDAYALVTTCGLTASALIAATTNDPTAEIVSSFQSALRARYAEADWLTVMKPINDTIRGLQRDALVAYVLQQLGDQPTTSDINTPDKLFEYFLMDVEMDPCMQTSRIRHALSSVQLFIERCLRNLEPEVASANISAAQWEWMKRYRVWEANREVFLWPENWLDPELRTDQSQFFKDTMSELLQSDITDDSATVAFLNYLSKLEEVAKLEPCGIHYIPRDPNNQNSHEVAHVVARTAGANRKYYYRRLEFGNWTPWEQIKLDIEDTPVIPVVWNDRLLLFWLRILKETPIAPQATASSGGQKDLASLTLNMLNQTNVATQSSVTVQAVLCWSEYYNGKWQPTKTSDVNRPTALIFKYPPTGPYAFDRSQLRLRAGLLSGQSTDPLLVNIFFETPYSELTGIREPGFVFYNTHSLPVRWEDMGEPLFNLPSRLRFIATTYPSHVPSTFSIYYIDNTGSPILRNDILQTNIGERVVGPQPGLPDLPDIWDAPFFFEDSHNVFYVTTDEVIKPFWSFDGYGVPLGVENLQTVTIPPLVLQQQPTVPDKIDPVIALTSLGSGPGDPIAMERFVSEDANIRTAISTRAAIQYNGREIGLAGSLADGQLS